LSTRESPSIFGVPWECRGPVGRSLPMWVETLVKEGDEVGTYQAHLAESWEFAADKSYLDFHLRQGVKFHDGTDFNAAAAKWNLDHFLGQNVVKHITSFEIIDDYTLRANLSDWDISVIDGFSRSEPAMISPTYYETHGNDWCLTHPCGTGAFMLKEYVPRQVLALERFPDYWQKGLPYLDGIEIHTIVDPVTLELEFRNGGIDVLEEADIPTAEALLAEGYTVAPLEVGGLMVLWLNSTDTDSIFSDPKIRQACEYAVDKEAICSALGGGLVSPNYEVIGGIHQVTDPGTTPRKYDPAKAKQLLAEAGYPDGFECTLALEDKFYTDFVVACQEDLSEVGITVDIDIQSHAQWSETRFSVCPLDELHYDRGQGGAFGIALSLFENLNPEGNFFQGVSYPAGWMENLNELMHLEDINDQIPILVDMEKQAYEVATIVPLWWMPNLDFFSERLKWDTTAVRDFRYSGGDPFPHMEHVWLDE